MSPALLRTLLLPPLLGGLAACSFAPDYVTPTLPVPAQFPHGGGEDAPSIARIGWRDFFRDPQLQDLIEQALEHNRDLRVAAGRVAEARANYRIQGAPLYPQLQASGNYIRAEAGGELPDTGQSIVIEQLAAQVSAGWEIDFWGRTRNLRGAALEQYLSSEEGRRAVATQLVAQVANGWLLELEYAERIALAQRSLATRERAAHLMRRRYEVGSGSRLEVTQTQTLLAQAHATLEALEMDRATNRNALALLVGHPVALEPRSLALAAVAEGVALPTGLPSEMLANRPDIMAAEHTLRAASANIGAARAAFFPNVKINTTANYGRTSIEGLFDGETGLTWMFQPQISLPLFDGGRNRANLDLAEARKITAVADYEKTVQEAFRDVADALARRRWSGRQLESLREARLASTERTRLAQLRYDNGKSAYLEVLDAQRDLFDAEQQVARLERAHLASGVALYAALGGGFADGAAAAQGHGQVQGQEQRQEQGKVR